MPHQCSELAATSNHSRKIFKIHRVPPQARASLILSEAWGVRCHRPPCAERAAEAQQHFRNDTWREMTLGPFTAPGGEPCLRLRRHRLPLPSPQTAPVSAEGQPVAASRGLCGSSWPRDPVCSSLRPLSSTVCSHRSSSKCLVIWLDLSRVQFPRAPRPQTLRSSLTPPFCSASAADDQSCGFLFLMHQLFLCHALCFTHIHLGGVLLSNVPLVSL